MSTCLDFYALPLLRFTILTCYRPRPKNGEGNVFTLSTPGAGGGGGFRSSRRGQGRSVSRPGGGQVQPAGGGPGGSGPAGGGGGSGQSADEGGGVRSSRQEGGVRSSRGGVSILHLLAGGMPLAFTQEDFLVYLHWFLNWCRLEDRMLQQMQNCINLTKLSLFLRYLNEVAIADWRRSFFEFQFWTSVTRIC